MKGCWVWIGEEISSISKRWKIILQRSEWSLSFVWTLNLDVASIQEPFLATLSDGNHNSYPISYSSSGKHTEWTTCPLTPMQKVKQGFIEDSSCLYAVYLHLFYCNHSWKSWYGFCVYTANLVEKTLPAERSNLFPRFQLVFNQFPLEHICVFILKQSHFSAKW